MRLYSLSPKWKRHVLINETQVAKDTLTFKHAQGIVFVCPACASDLTKTHRILIWFAERGVPDEAVPPRRWCVSEGNGFDDLTIVSSIKLETGCKWHGVITEGNVIGAAP